MYCSPWSTEPVAGVGDDAYWSPDIRTLNVLQAAADEVYVVLAGEATLEAEGDSRRLRPGDAAFVAVGKEHHFVDYELISVLVLFTRAA